MYLVSEKNEPGERYLEKNIRCEKARKKAWERKNEEDSIHTVRMGQV